MKTGRKRERDKSEVLFLPCQALVEFEQNSIVYLAFHILFINFIPIKGNFS